MGENDSLPGGRTATTFIQEPTLRALFLIPYCVLVALLCAPPAWSAPDSSSGANASIEQPSATNPSATPPSSETGNDVTVFPGVSEIVSRLATLSTNLTATQTQLDEIAAMEQIKDNLDKVMDRQHTLDQRIKELGDPEQWSFERLLETRTVLVSQQSNLATIFDSLSAKLTILDNLRNQWQQRKTFWSEWKTYLVKERTEFPEGDFDRSVEKCSALLKNIADTSGKLIEVQQQMVMVQDGNDTSIRQIDTALKNLRAQIFKKTARSFFSSEFYQQFNAELKVQVKENFKLVQWYRKSYLHDYWWVAVMQLMLALGLAVNLRKHRKNNDASQWNILFRHPWAAGLFMAFATLSPLYKAPPLAWTFYLLLISVITASILVAGIVPERRHAMLIWLLAFIYLVSMFLQVIGLPLPLLRLYLAVLSLVGIPLLVWMCALSRRNKDSWQLIIGQRIGVILLAISLIAQLGGYSTLSMRLVDASIKTVFVLLMVYMVMRLTQGGVDYLLRHPWAQSWKFFKIFGSRLSKKINHLMVGALSVYAVLYTVQIWGGSDSVTTTWSKIKDLGFTFGNVELTLSTLIMMVLIMYLAFTLSWLVRSLFDVEVVGPRYMDSGLRDSLKTLLHYVIISCGLLLTLGALGIGLQNFAVIAGALGIGIGFGLQNIVNNFISGLILLFERPIKLGDRIILDGEWAIVRKIGLRSTVIETYNQAEIIVPNSQLISEKVTNLTHSNSRARITIDVGVAYGENIERVLEILKEEAKNNPTVLKYPEPSPLFVAFGASSLDFKLRVWLDNFDQSLDVKSDLSVAIYKRFDKEGIAIPFPQRDLHLRSVSENVWRQWRGEKAPVDLQPAFEMEEEHQTGSDHE
jgi:small-conductance mechanosensitive channel